MSRLCVTGVGVVTALGFGVERTWTALVAGERGIGKLDLFETEGQRSTIAAQVRGVVVPPEPGWSRTSALALSAAREALDQARLERSRLRVGLVVAGTTGGMLEAEGLLARLHKSPDERDAWAGLFAHPLTSTADRLEQALGPFARARTLTSACSGGANALVVGAHWLLSGDVDVVLAGGSDGLCRLTFTGFNALGAMDPEPCRPFDRRRKGLNLGEGAGFVVLERAEHADRRGATPLADLAGWSVGAEAHHITNPEPTGETAARLVTGALARAGLSPSDVDYVNAHGTATPLNDPMEAAALARALGDEVKRVPVSSSKGQIGHTLGAAGAVEAAIAVLSVARRAIPPTAGLEEPDPTCALVHQTGRGRPARVRAAVSTSFGFGGMDAVLAFTEPGYARMVQTPRRSVVITGAMALAPCGSAVGAEGASLLASALDGRRIDDVAHAHLDLARSRRLDRASRLGVAVVEGALADAGLAAGAAPGAGVVLSSAFGWVDGSAAFMARVFEKGPRLASPADFPNLVPSSPTGHVSIYLGLRGPAMGTADLATSAESAIAQAAELVASGEADVVVGGALEELTRIVDRVMAALFGREVEGRSEGVCAAVFESDAHARARGARVLARVEQLRSWRGAVPGMLDLAAPTSASRVVVPREDPQTSDLLARSGWGDVARDVCAPSLGEHEGVGGMALAVALGRLGSAEADRVVVVGQVPGRGYALTLAR